jgi:hypothetical protein
MVRSFCCSTSIRNTFRSDKHEGLAKLVPYTQVFVHAWHCCLHCIPLHCAYTFSIYVQLWLFFTPLYCSVAYFYNTGKSEQPKLYVQGKSTLKSHCCLVVTTIEMCDQSLVKFPNPTSHYNPFSRYWADADRGRNIFKLLRMSQKHKKKWITVTATFGIVWLTSTASVV